MVFFLIVINVLANRMQVLFRVVTSRAIMNHNSSFTVHTGDAPVMSKCVSRKKERERERERVSHWIFGKKE